MSSWEYTAGRISALETSLLSDRTWGQITGSPGIEDLLKLLGDTWYGHLIHGDAIEDALNRAVSTAEDELLELDTGSGLANAMLLRRDVRNARYVWKDMAGGGDGAVPQEADGAIPATVFARAWNDPAQADGLPAEFRSALESVRGLPQGDSLGVDMILDQLAASVEKNHMGSLDPELLSFARSRIELGNFLTAGRLGTGNMAAGRIEEWLLQGGFHTPEEILEALRKNRLPEALAENPGFEAAAVSLKEALDGGSFLPFQKESDRVILGLLSGLSAKPFGPGLLASYVLRRELEAVHLNLVVAAKKAEMNTVKLLARLPR